MVSIITDLPSHVVGIRAAGIITHADFETVLKPALEDLQRRTGKLNYLLLLETPVSNFTAGAWIDDIVVGLKHFTHWNRIAVVTDEKFVEKFSNAFDFIVPGKSKGFTLSELAKAKEWVSAL